MGAGSALLHPDAMPLWDKMRTIAQEIYRATDIIADQRVRDQFRDIQAAGFGNLPICVAEPDTIFLLDRSESARRTSGPHGADP